MGVCMCGCVCVGVFMYGCVGVGVCMGVYVWVCVCVGFLYIYFPCMLHYHGIILHALFTDYMLCLSIIYTFNIQLSIYCALVVPDYCVYKFFKVF